jgi:hypothetical protein
LRQADQHSVVVRDGDRELGAIVSMEDFQLVRKARVDRAIRAMEVLGESLREAAAEEGISPEDLEKMFDRKAK